MIVSPIFLRLYFEQIFLLELERAKCCYYLSLLCWDFIAKQQSKKEEEESNFRRCLFNEWPVASSSFYPQTLFFFGGFELHCRGEKKGPATTTTTRDIRDSVRVEIISDKASFGAFLLLDVSTRVRWRPKETGNDEANDLFRLPTTQYGIEGEKGYHHYS